MSKLLLMLSMCIGFLPLPLQAAGSCERLVATGIDDYPPYLWRDPQNPDRLIGANADLLTRIGKEIGVEIELIHSGSWAEAQEHVRSGRIDLLAGALISLSGLASMDYVYPPLFNTASVVWMKSDRSFAFRGWDDLLGRRGAIQADSRFGPAFDSFSASSLQLQEAPTLAEALQLLQQDQADFVLHQRYPARALVAQLGLAVQLQAVEPAIFSEGLYLALSHNSACNDAWLRGQLAVIMSELAAAGVPQQLLQGNLERWEAVYAQPASDTSE
jgi:polar amino acid transport system substrate-binding protein